MASIHRIARDTAHETDARDCPDPTENHNNFAYVEHFFHTAGLCLPFVPLHALRKNVEKTPVLSGLREKVLGRWFFPSRTARLLLGNYVAHKLPTASKKVSGCLRRCRGAGPWLP